MKIKKYLTSKNAALGMIVYLNYDKDVPCQIIPLLSKDLNYGVADKFKGRTEEVKPGIVIKVKDLYVIRIHNTVTNNYRNINIADVSHIEINNSLSEDQKQSINQALLKLNNLINNDANFNTNAEL